VSCQSVQNFSTLYHKSHDFIKDVFEYKIGVIVFSTKFFSEIFLIQRIFERIGIKSVHLPSYKAPLILISFDRASSIMKRRINNQLDADKLRFIDVISSTFFGHHYAHHQD
jgi:hypothetical protein